MNHSRPMEHSGHHYSLSSTFGSLTLLRRLATSAPMKRIFAPILLLFLSSPLPFSHAQVSNPTRPSAPPPEVRKFGPYEAIAFNEEVINDVKVTEELKIWLQLKPSHKDKELVVKISNEKFAGYREWWNGGYELVSPAYQGKRAYEWTDYVQTKSRFIEYWMDGEIFLHLKRVDK